MKIEVFCFGHFILYKKTQQIYNRIKNQNMSSNTHFTTNSSTSNGISLCIPRVFNNINWRRVKTHMIEARLGFVERVDLIPIHKNGKNYKRAYVHFKKNGWNMRDLVARQALSALQTGQSIRITYDDPWYWELSISRQARPDKAPTPKDRKLKITVAGKIFQEFVVKHPRVEESTVQTVNMGVLQRHDALGRSLNKDGTPNLNDPITARMVEQTLSSARMKMKYDLALQPDDDNRMYCEFGDNYNEPVQCDGCDTLMDASELDPDEHNLAEIGGGYCCDSCYNSDPQIVAMRDDFAEE